MLLGWPGRLRQNLLAFKLCNCLMVEETVYRLDGIRLCLMLHLEVLLTWIVSLHPAARDSCNVMEGALPPVQHCLQLCS